MPYDPLTTAEFKTLKPQFADVADATVQAYLDAAALFVSTSWPETLYQAGHGAMTCHMMTIDGLGTDNASLSFAGGEGEFQTIRSGNVTVTRFRDASLSAGQSTSGWLGQTACGRMYLVWLRTFSGGPRIAYGGVTPSSGFWPC